RKAADFDLEERPCHQGALGAPSADPTVLVFALVGFPNRHDGEARCDEENRWMQYEAEPPESFGWQRWKGMGVDRQGIGGVLGFASRPLKLRDVRDIFDRCGVAPASEKPRKQLPVGKSGRSFGSNELTRHRVERLISGHAPSDGKKRGQAVERAAMGGQTVRAPAFRAGDPQRRVRTEAA